MKLLRKQQRETTKESVTTSSEEQTTETTETTESSATTASATTATETETTVATSTTESKTSETSGSVDPKNVLYGDVNLDGRVDITDAVLLNKVAAGAVTLDTPENRQTQTAMLTAKWTARTQLSC